VNRSIVLARFVEQDQRNYHADHGKLNRSRVVRAVRELSATDVRLKEVTHGPPVGWGGHGDAGPR
jgi:hypothetical protein